MQEKVRQNSEFPKPNTQVNILKMLFQAPDDFEEFMQSKVNYHLRKALVKENTNQKLNFGEMMKTLKVQMESDFRTLTRKLNTLERSSDSSLKKKEELHRTVY